GVPTVLLFVFGTGGFEIEDPEVLEGRLTFGSYQGTSFCRRGHSGSLTSGSGSVEPIPDIETIHQPFVDTPRTAAGRAFKRLPAGRAFEVCSGRLTARYGFHCCDQVTRSAQHRSALVARK